MTFIAGPVSYTHLGADDYITKPFNILEVKARIKAIIRRNKRKAPAKTEEPKVITSGKLKLDIEAKRLYICLLYTS